MRAQVAEVCYAKVQGCNGCIEHFKNAKFACLDADCLPLVFVPAVRGACCALALLLPCHAPASLHLCPLQLASEPGRHSYQLADCEAPPCGAWTEVQQNWCRMRPGSRCRRWRCRRGSRRPRERGP